jgi:hypothetical protein
MVFSLFTGVCKMQFDFVLDIESVKAGSVIDQAEVEKVVGVRRSEDAYAYQFALLQFGDFIAKTLWRNGKQLTVTTNDGAVQILTHAEASVYNAKQFELAMAKLRRCNRRLGAVDASQLTPDDRQDHVKAMIRQSRILSAVKIAKKPVELEQSSDNRPRLFVTAKEPTK